MAIFKCKMCGGQLEITEGTTVCTCEYCGTEQTLPKLDSDKKANLYDRANHFRRNNDFDKAMGIYEQILNEDSTDAEAYWSLVLCRYGIEYVEDPVTHKRIPTINRAQYTSIYADENYKAAIEYADTLQKTVYETEAKTIDEIQKGILAISEKEEPFDVFICYKETDENGRRTPDSVLANDLYHQLTQEGFKVFFSRITLEDKLGQEYEPYIFAALNSAKVMVALGTKPEYYRAVWVRNEWSRFLALIKSGAKKMLIPAYKDMDPYDLPEEFSHLQAQDMSKLGFMQDLIRGIKKILEVDKKPEKVQETVVVQQSSGGTTADAQVMRGNMALEDGEWEKADGFFEEALNLDPKCAEAFLGKFLAKEKVSNLEGYVEKVRRDTSEAETERLIACPEDTEHIEKMVEENEAEIGNYLLKSDIRASYEFDRGYYSELESRREQKIEVLSELEEDKLLVRARNYASQDLLAALEKMTADITSLLDLRIAEAESEDEISISDKKAEYAAFLTQKDAEIIERGTKAKSEREALYQRSVERMERAKTDEDYEEIVEILSPISVYKDTESQIVLCKKRADEIREESRKKLEREQEIERKKKEEKRRKKELISIISVFVTAALIMIIFLVTKMIIPNKKYNDAVKMMNAGRYEEAIVAFEMMGGYKDSLDQIEQCQLFMKENDYNTALALMNERKYEEAIAVFKMMVEYKDSLKQIKQCQQCMNEEDYNTALELMKEGKYEEAIVAFEELGEYKDNLKQVEKCQYGILKNAEKGDIVSFGDYIGKKEWIVLDRVEGKVLMLSKDVIINKEYNNGSEDITWEQSSLRKWLNTEYMNAAFSEDEKMKIVENEVENKDNAGNGTAGGNNTKDKVFLLSIDEVSRYFISDKERIVKTYDGMYAWWWLRSPGYYGNYAAYVSTNGSVNENGDYVNFVDGAVRPALWIDTTNP